MSRLIYAAFPAFIVLMVIEFFWARRALREGAAIRGYAPHDTAASLAMGIGNVVVSVGTKLAVLAIFSWLWKFRIYTFPADAWWSWVLLFFVEDFCYYWFHRVHHEVRLFWAAHINHHSSTHSRRARCRGPPDRSALHHSETSGHKRCLRNKDLSRRRRHSSRVRCTLVLTAR